MLTNYTLNEEVKPSFSFALDGPGSIVVVYQPLMYRGVISVMGGIHRERDFSLIDCFQGTNEVIYASTTGFGRGLLISGSFDKQTGIIKLFWKKHIESHVLSVSYDFTTEREVSTINWLQEGF